MSEVRKTPKGLELEWEEKYGGVSERDLTQTIVKDMISQKTAILQAKAEMEKQKRAEYDTLSYGDLVKSVASARKKVSDLEGTPEQLKEKKRAQLNKEFEHLAKFDRAPSDNKELWVSDMLLRYMSKSDGEYSKAKVELAKARKEYAILLAKKEEREGELADVIEAEKYRTRRADLLSADPEALRALGIEPPPSVSPESDSTEETTPTGHFMDIGRRDDYWLEVFMESRGYGKSKEE